MNNLFFDIALNRAAKLSGKNGKIFLLLTRMSAKLASVNWSEISVSAAKAKLSVFSRITKAYTSGKYRTIPWKAIVTILGAIIYFLNPVDLIPDFIPGLGLTDDFGVLVWVYGSLSVEIDKFLGWESEISIL